MCPEFGNYINKLENFPMSAANLEHVHERFYVAVFHLSEEGEKFKRILANHQIHETQTVIDTVQARLQELTNGSHH